MTCLSEEMNTKRGDTFAGYLLLDCAAIVVQECIGTLHILAMMRDDRRYKT